MTPQHPRPPESNFSSHQPSQHQIYSVTSESVSDGHPDKLADQISDTVLDTYLAEDPSAKVAAECLITKDLVVLAGEISTTVKGLHEYSLAKIPDIVRQLLRRVGYTAEFPGINPEKSEIQLHINRQSPDINCGVERGEGRLGAGDQGMMFGYACDDTPDLLPLPISLAHALVRRHAQLRQTDKFPWLKPDAKSQVTVRYRNHTPVAVETVVFSTQHSDTVEPQAIHRAVSEAIIEEVIPAALRDRGLRVFINPTGRFVTGGPEGDTGLTGRKIAVDTYGGFCPHGGGALSGKDPSKVDRSAAYAARQVAKSVVAAQLAARCTVQLAYAIGVAEPVSLVVNCHGTGTFSDWRISEMVREIFALTPAAIISSLDLCRPIYQKTAAFGHFGRSEPEFTWEKPLAQQLAASASDDKNPSLT